MKQFCLFSFIISLSITSFAQQWNKVGSNLEAGCINLYSDTLSDNMIISGYFHEYNGIVVNGIMSWDGSNSFNLGGIELFTFYDVVRYHDTLYGAVAFDINNPIFTLVGWFDESDSTWNGIPDFDNDRKGGLLLHDLVVYKDELVLIGNYNWASSPQENIVSFDGQFFHPIVSNYNKGSTMNGGIVFNEDLYLFGGFDTIESRRIVNVAKWNGVFWDSVARNDITTYMITSMGVYKDTLYAGTYEGNLFKLDSNEWQLVATGDARIMDMMEDEGKFYIGGHFIKIDNKIVNRICYYDGKSFHAMENGVDGAVSTIEKYKGDIFIGGGFEIAGHVDANFISRWGLPIGIEKHLAQKDGLTIHPNPSSGQFVIEMVENSSPDISIYNSLGLLVYHGSYNDVERIDIDIPFNTGIYFVKVCVDGSVSDYKLVVE